MENLFTKEIPSYGDVMELSEWIECCEDGGFIDYDGYGYASDGVKMSDKSYHPSDRDKIPTGTTHIVWFNR